MTKPIEGWVAWHEKSGTIEYASMAKDGDTCMQFLSLSFAPAIPDEHWKPRSVQITFTDELDTVVRYKRLEELRNEKDIPQPVVEKEIADAIRKERERIWEGLTDHDNQRSGYDPASIEILREKLRGIIFGEEK